MTDEKKRHTKRRLTRLACILAVVLAVILLLALAVAGYVHYLREKGRDALLEHASQTAVVLRQPEFSEESKAAEPESSEKPEEDAQSEPSTEESQAAEPESSEEATEEEEQDTVLKAGQVRYGGKVYQYKENLLTILCLGIDSRDGIGQVKIPGKGGQADCIILAVLDGDSKEIQLINVSRDTMVPIELYDTAGGYVRTERRQITLQYAYGNGRERSCELMEKVVSDLFYGIPIHGYCALAMNSIADLNDAIGGITVTIPQEMADFMDGYTAGETITLKGTQAVDFVHARNIYLGEYGANNRRIERQKTYVTAFIDQAKRKIKEDLTLPARLYQTVESQMVTSISLDQAVYLCTEYLDCRFSMDNIRTVAGTITKPDVYEEYTVDEKALYELILDVFYEEVR